MGLVKVWTVELDIDVDMTLIDSVGANGAGADCCPRSGFGTEAGCGNYGQAGPYSAEPYYGLDGRPRAQAH